MSGLVEITDVADIAVAAIREELRSGRPWEPSLAGLEPRLTTPGASFVTLERHGELLGCVGNLEPREPLAIDVARSARLAAFEDPRMPPVDAGAYVEMTVKVSVLSPLEEMPAGSQDEVLSWLRRETDGLVLACGLRRATFLPSVWQSVTDATEFVMLLARKAGLDGAGWPRGMRAWRYTTVETSAAGPRPAP